MGICIKQKSGLKIEETLRTSVVDHHVPHETVTYGDPPFSTRKLPRLGRRRSILGREGTLKFPDVGLCQTFSTILPKTIGGSEEFSKS